MVITHPVRFPPGSVVPAGLYRSTGSGRVRFFDGGTPLPGSVNSSSWQQVADHYRVVRTSAPATPHATVPEAPTRPVRFAAGTLVSPGEYRNTTSGRVRYFDGTTPLPGGVNATAWQQVSDHFHAHSPAAEFDRRPIIEFPVPRVREAAAATAVLTPPEVAVPAPAAPLAPPNAGELAVALVDRVNAGEDAAIAELFAPEANIVFPVGPLLVFHHGQTQLRRFLGWLRANVDEHELSLERISGDEQSVTVDFDTRGTSIGGVAFDHPGAMVIEANQGRITLVQVVLGARRAA